VAALVMLAGPSPASPARPTAERLMFVDCLLPGALRKLGGRMLYQGPRRAVRATVDDCEIRGGEYTAYDRADPAAALQVWLPQAQRGDEAAEVYVGELYEAGVGTGPDYALAAQWYGKAADAGSSDGRMHLAYLYEQGLGVARDPVRAANLYRAAAGLTSDELIFRSELDTRVAGLSDRLQQQSQALASLSEELEQTRTKLDAQREATSQAQRSADRLRAKLDGARGAGAARESDALRQQLAAQEQRLTEERKQVQDLERTSAQQASVLAQRLADSQREDSRLQAELGDVQVQTANTRSQLATARERQSALEQEAAQFRENARKLEVSLQEARTRQQATVAEKAALAAELQRQQAVAHSLDAERLTLQDQVQRLQTQLQAAQSSGHQSVEAVTSLRAQLAALEVERITKSRQVADLLIHVQADSRALAEARERLSQAEARLDTQGEAMKKLSSELQERETDLQKELARVRGLKAGVKSDQSQITELRTQIGTKGLSPAAQTASLSSLPGPGPGLDARGVRPGRSFALIIANAFYHDPGFPALPSVKKDEKAVEGALGRYGFKDRMMIVENGTRDDIMNAVAAFSAQLGPDDSALIYYTGHGALVEANSATYWLPADAQQGSPASWVATSWVTEMIGQMRARHILVVVDSCYAGVLVHSTNMRMVSRSAATEPERIRALASLPSRTVLTSGGDAPVASDGPGGYSVFARQFTRILEQNTGVLDASALYDELSDAMSQAGPAGGSGAPQLPRYSILVNTHHLNGDFLFVPSERPRT
jgi:TPR repeat protein